jgi:hypothetical protein
MSGADLNENNDVFYGNYSSANFRDAEDTRPFLTNDTALISIGESSGKITPAVQNLILRHTLEIQGKSDISLSTSGVNNVNQLRRKLRDFYTKEQQGLFNYLEQNTISVPTISAYNTIIKRFGRPDFSVTNSSLRDLKVDISGETVLTEINERLGMDLATFTAGMGRFMGLLKDVTDEIMKTEDELRIRLDAIDKLTKNVQSVLTLNSANPVYETMIACTETYIKEAIRQNSIEDVYKSVITAYKKLALLKEGFLGARIISSAGANEPLCSVCISEPVGYCVAPCGHTFCQTCSRRQTMQCFICRGQIRERVKLYFS